MRMLNWYKQSSCSRLQPVVTQPGILKIVCLVSLARTRHFICLQYISNLKNWSLVDSFVMLTSWLFGSHESCLTNQAQGINLSSTEGFVTMARGCFAKVTDRWKARFLDLRHARVCKGTWPSGVYMVNRRLGYRMTTFSKLNPFKIS